MEIRITEAERRTLIQPIGDVQVTSLDEIRAPIEKGLERGAVIVDFSAVDFIDSSGLGLFISFSRKNLNRGRLLLAALRPMVMEVIRIARLDRVLEIHENLESALKREIPRRILIIDSDEATRSVAEAVLSAYDYSVQAVAAVKEADETPFDLIVADAGSHNEFKSRLASFGSPPLLLLVETKGAMESDLETEDLSFLPRPFDPYDFLGKVRILLKDRSGGGARILALVASRDLAEKIRFVLERHDYTLSVATTAAAFRTQLKQGDWSVCILDAEPVGDCVENLVDSIREADAGKTPIVILGAVTADDIRYLASAGVRDFLSTPLLPESLIGKLSRYIKAPVI